ncbi:MAG TPA: hypothetical protein VJA23_03795 [Candidatus Nanoarchaeia archaeon]|nr:hypothetical protein [Candidatus Nanoarchaeia archaeon]
MDIKSFQNQLNQKINSINIQFNLFLTFLLKKLQNFKNLTLGEQISYCSFGGGLLLVMISIILFII